MTEKTTVHPSAFVEENVELGENVKIWHFCQIRTGAKIGKNVNIGKDSYIDSDVTIGNNCRIQNHVNIFSGVILEDWVFIGPSVVFTNDQYPRVGNKKWKIIETKVNQGASIGAGAVVRCGITIGNFAMIGAGAIVTKDVSAFTLVVGAPAHEQKKICACGQTALELDVSKDQLLRDCCKENMCNETYALAQELIEKL
jgi:UDP-2-acetamido-3-amino-2,3-dideoxy-glucuronate N-acetyltransferase